MSESGDPAIKLFGKKIQFPDSKIRMIPHQIKPLDQQMGECQEATVVSAEHCVARDSIKNTVSGIDSVVNKSSQIHISKNNKHDEDQGHGIDGICKEKALKRPEKFLSCPRCNSSDTKFCYFNNYNVNQPRHYCKNCQRYWTAGGTMRNVAIGAGRRKNKHSPLQCHNDANTPNASCHQVSSAFSLPATETVQIQKGNTGIKEKIEEPSSSNSIISSQWAPHPMLLSGFCAPGIGLQFVPTSYWATMPGWQAVGCNMPGTLGKHSREPDSDEKAEKFLWVPKTLRIDEANEAAKCSLLATLGIKSDKAEPVFKSGVFKVFRQKTEKDGSPTSETGPVLQANPAAFSRSQTFQERT